MLIVLIQSIQKELNNVVKSVIIAQVYIFLITLKDIKSLLEVAF